MKPVCKGWLCCVFRRLHRNSHAVRFARMTSHRLEAFSDGVLAIIITIMMLELKIPHVRTLPELQPLLPVFLSYLLSFIYVGIYWSNHHHLFQSTEKVTGVILWANLHLLFWLSLFPFATGWMGENHLAPTPVAVYGFVLLVAAVAYNILQRLIVHEQGPDSLLAAAIGSDWKGKISPVLYLVGTVCAFFNVWVSIALYIAVAFIWFIPDRRIEEKLAEQEDEAEQKN